jgi:hypothetical protein
MEYRHYFLQDNDEYQRYLASREWALKREAVKKRCNNICERCGVNPVKQVHHLTYIRLYKEKLEDLQGICKECHEYESAKRTLDPIELKRILDCLKYNAKAKGKLKIRIEISKKVNLKELCESLKQKGWYHPIRIRNRVFINEEIPIIKTKVGWLR